MRTISTLALAVIVGCGAYAAPTAAAAASGPTTTPAGPYGTPHGFAAVHNTVWVDAPVEPSGWTTVSYAWKIDGVYSYGHHYYGFGWATYGKTASLKILQRSPSGQGYSTYYNFGTVLAPATARANVHLVIVGGPVNPATGSGNPPHGVPGTVEALLPDGRVVAQASTNATGAVTVMVPPGTYRFVGRMGTTGGYWCGYQSPVTLTAGTSPFVEVLCPVP